MTLRISHRGHTLTQEQLDAITPVLNAIMQGEIEDDESVRFAAVEKALKDADCPVPKEGERPVSDFEREERYIVVKLKDTTTFQRSQLNNCLVENKIPTRECVVVEDDWAPIYGETWENVRRYAKGQQSIGQERDSLDREIAQHDTDRSAERVARMKAERRADALEAHAQKLEALAHALCGKYIANRHDPRYTFISCITPSSKDVRQGTSEVGNLWLNLAGVLDEKPETSVNYTAAEEKANG